MQQGKDGGKEMSKPNIITINIIEQTNADISQMSETEAMKQRQNDRDENKHKYDSTNATEQSTDIISND